MTKRRRLLIVAFAAALAVGLAIGFAAGRIAPRPYSHKEVSVSAACAADVKAAANLLRYDTGQIPPPQQAPLQSSADDCGTVDEWATAALRYPDSLGPVPDNSAIGQAVTAICGTLTPKQRSHAPLCRDAKRYAFDLPAAGPALPAPAPPVIAGAIDRTAPDFRTLAPAKASPRG